MNLSEFKKSLKDVAPPEDANEILKALWYDAQGDWESAHEIVQSIQSPLGAKVHAYLHRKEGDRVNASYWYKNAKSEVYKGTLEEEWNKLINDLTQ
ncbi:MAG: hypothetical protein MI922_02575 [Bacteroidales bacterium]|nr:hypothetical protein [Bacteroidales bacterium]